MLQWIISSSVLIAVILLLRLLLKGRISLRLQYGLWALVLLRLLLPFTIGSSPISVSNFAPTEAQTPPPVVAVDQESADQDQTPIVVPDQNRQPQVEDQIPQSQTSVTQQPVTQQPITQQPVTQAPTEPAATDSHNKINLSTAEILRILRVIGSVAVGIWFAAVNLRMHRKLRASRRPLEVENCSLPVYVSDQVDTPCLFGLFRPAIYLTEDCLEDESTLRYAIVHEQTHYRHLDFLWALLRCLCLALHWYNPLVWWAALASQKDAELACDESVLRRLGDSDRAPYGRALLRLTCEKRPRLLSVSTTMTGSAKNIKERITMIVKKPKMAIYTLVAVLLITAITVGCTFTGAEKDIPDDSRFDDFNDSQITTPGDALNALFRDGGEMTVATRLRDKPFSEERRIDLQWHLSSFLSAIDSAVIWTAAEEVDLETFAHCMMFRSADGRQILTVCDNVAQYEDGDRTLCWKAEPYVVSYFTIASNLRDCYFRLDHISEDRLVVQGCTPEAAVTYYVEKNHEGELRNNIQGMQGQLHDYALIDYGVDETSGDQGETVGYIVYAFATDLPDSSIIWGQEAAFGIGEYNGMLVRYERFLLRQREGSWYLAGSRNSHPLAELPEDQTICDSTDRSKPYITKLEDGLYTLSDREGTVLFEMSNVIRVPTEIRLTDSVYEFTLQTGTGLSTNWAVFYDSRNNSVSETYQYVLGARGDYVIYVEHEGDQEHVIVQNIFDPAAYRQVYALDRPSKGDTSARGEYTADGNMTVRYCTEDGSEAAITVELPKTEQETISYASVWSAALEGSAQEAVQIYAEQFHRQIALDAMAWGMPINLDLYRDFRLIDYSILSIGEDGNSVKFEVRYSYRPVMHYELDGESTPGNVQTTSSTHRLVRAVDGLWHLGMISGGSDEPSQAPTSPKEAFELVYGEVQQLRMYLRSNRGEARPILRISAPSYHAILFAAVETTGWEIVNPSEFPSDSDDTIVLLSEDGRHMLSASGKLLLYETEGLRLCWREPDNIWWREEENLTQYLYDRIYNNELNAYRRSPIACDGTAEEAARLYAEREFAAAREEWDNPENLRTNWNILEVSEDGNTIVFTYSASYTPEYLDNGTEGNIQLIFHHGQEVTLRKMSDGRWYYIDPGTAGTTVQDHFDIVF